MLLRERIALSCRRLEAFSILVRILADCGSWISRLQRSESLTMILAETFHCSDTSIALRFAVHRLRAHDFSRVARNATLIKQAGRSAASLGLISAASELRNNFQATEQVDYSCDRNHTFSHSLCRAMSTSNFRVS